MLQDNTTEIHSQGIAKKRPTVYNDIVITTRHGYYANPMTKYEEELAMKERAAEQRTYSVHEATKILGISRNSAYDGVRRGEIPVIKGGGRLLVPAAALNRLLGMEGRERRIEVGES